MRNGSEIWPLTWKRWITTEGSELHCRKVPLATAEIMNFSGSHWSQEDQREGSCYRNPTKHWRPPEWKWQQEERKSILRLMTRLDGGNGQVRDRESSRRYLGFWLEWWVHGGANHWQRSRGGVYLPPKALHRWEEKGKRHSLPHPLTQFSAMVRCMMPFYRCLQSRFSGRFL